MKQNKICALMRQTWYETAKRNLSEAQRLRFYEMCFEYEFNGVEPDPNAPFAARLLFDMVRDNLDGDKIKANERAERNRRNGAQGGRPPKNSEEESNKSEQNTENPQKPTGFYENPIYTTLHNTTQKGTKNISVIQTEDTHIFFSICLDFFARGCSDPVGQGEKMWNYYEALGWKTAGGGAIVDKLAIARAWRLPDCSKSQMIKRTGFVELMKKANTTDTAFLRDFVDIKRDANDKSVVITFVNKETAMKLDTSIDREVVLKWLPADDSGTPFALKYRIMQEML